MALSEIYVDPSLASDTGTGTDVDPFGDLEYAIEQTTFDTVNGTRVNVKSGATETLVANIAAAMADVVTTVAWVPSATAPCVFQGYTSAAGDGGIGVISGGGSVAVFTHGGADHVHFADLRVTNCGANAIVALDTHSSVRRCRIDTGSAGGVVAGNYSHVADCYFHDITAGGTAITLVTGGRAFNNYVDLTSSGVTRAISGSTGAHIFNNIVLVDTGTDGILGTNGASITHNSVYSAGGTGSGVLSSQSTYNNVIINNLVEGFSGAGGIGVEFPGPQTLCYGNSVYDCETAVSLTGPAVDNLYNDNETLSDSPFSNAPTSFAPANVGNVKEGALPQTIGGGYI